MKDLEEDNAPETREPSRAPREPSPASEEPAAVSEDRAARLERLFRMPVIVAAIAAIPAVFLSMLDGTAQLIGNVINFAALGVFAAEAVTLFFAAENRRRWIREHRFLITVLLLTIPAVILFIGAVQVLRLAQFTRFLEVGKIFRFARAFRIVRLNRIVKSGRALQMKAGLTGWSGTATGAGVVVAALAFLVAVLSDPDSQTRQIADGAVARLGMELVLGGATVLGLAALLGLLWLKRRRSGGFTSLRGLVARAGRTGEER